MASSSHIKEFPRETDPELLAALAKLADGCDELRRWIKSSSARAIADANRHGQTNIIKRVNTFSDDEYQQVLGLTGSPDHLEPNDSDVADAADRVSSKTRSLTGPAPVMPPPTLKPETHSVHRSDFDIQRSQASPYSGSINVRTRDPNDILVEYPLTEEEIRKSKENLLKRFDSDLFVITLMELLDPDLDALSQDYFVERHGQEIEHIKKDIEMSWPEEFPARDESLHYIYDSTRRFNTIRVWYFGGTKESFLHPHDMTYLFQAFSSSPAYSTDVDVDNAMLFMKDLSRFCPAFRMISGSSSPLRLSVRACECFALGQWDSPFSSSLPAISPLCAIKFERQKGRILNKNTGNGIDLREWCSVTYFDTRGTVILWSDDFMPLIANDQEIKPCGWHGEGFTVLLRIVVEVYKEWNSIWGKTLEKIDGLVSVKPADTLDRKYWQTLMFDSGFEISETYFTILQMLRIFDDWIEETESDFTKLNDNIVSRAQSMVIYEDADVDLTILTTNLNVVMGRLQSSAKSLRDRIKRKKEEVQSLRDGLFNAASLREAVNARTLNLFVIIFTVITVIYTPLGFLAALWAMSNLSRKLDGDTDAATPGSFIASWIALPLGTYLASMVFLFVAWVNTSPEGGSFWAKAQRKITDAWKPAREVRSKFDFKRMRKLPFQLGKKSNGFLSRETRRPEGNDVELESGAGGGI